MDCQADRTEINNKTNFHMLCTTCITGVRHYSKNCSQGAAEAVARRCSVKKVLLKISENSQENTCARVSFFKFY